MKYKYLIPNVSLKRIEKYSYIVSEPWFASPLIQALKSNWIVFVLNADHWIILGNLKQK